MADVWECYGHGVPGIAVVGASSRALALQACFEWLGWQIGVAFKKPERFTVWMNCGGSAESPVVYAEDGEHFVVLKQRVITQQDNGRIASLEDTIVREYWEDKL
jgi:hypothetical protein